MHPLFYEGPRMVKPPVVQIAGMLRARRRPGSSTDDLDLDLRRRRPAPLRPAERLRLGRGALARHRAPPRPLVGRRAGRPSSTRSLEEGYAAKETAEGGRREGAALLGQADAEQADAEASSMRFAGRVEADRHRGLAAEHLPRPAPERPAHPDRHQPRLPDRMRNRDPMPPPRPHRCCGEHTRAELLRRDVAEAGKGLPAIEPACRRPPAPASRGARSCCARAGWR